jgi:hypothetical protein
MSKGQGYKIGRDDDSGRYKSVEDARRDKNNSSVEVNPKPGHGDSGRYDKKKDK